MNKCPNCGELTISNYKKFMLGPGRTIECPSCKARISVSWWTMALLLGMLMIMFTIDDLLSSGVYTIVALGVMGVYLFIHKHFIPLEVRKDS